jgi:hypothetical protein
MKTFNIICIKWGNMYNSIYVNNLYSSIKRNTSFNINFYCFTDDSTGLNSYINIYPLPQSNISDKNVDKTKFSFYCWLYKTAGLCDNNLADLINKRVYFFDLDVVITDNLDDFFLFPKYDEFIIINDWNTRGNHVGQASCFSFVVGNLGYIKKDLEENYLEIMNKYGTASQEYLSTMIINKTGQLLFWPDDWITSFKFHAVPCKLLRNFIYPRLPSKTKILVFHGHPKIDDAILGYWSKTQPLHKKIYNTSLPCKWLENCWHDGNIIKYTHNLSFNDEFNKFKQKLINNEHFALIRFGDGELEMIKNGYHNHKQHSFNNNIPLDLRKLLINCLEYKSNNFYQGIPCECYESVDKYRKYIYNNFNVNHEQLTFANLYLNTNYKNFNREIVSIFKKFNIILVSNEKTDLSQLARNNFNIIKWFSIKQNAWKDYENICESVINYVNENKITNHLFIMCAGPISNILIYKLHKIHPNNIYLDLGSAFDNELGLNTNSRNYSNTFGWKSLATCYWNNPDNIFQISCNSQTKSKFTRFLLKIISFLYKQYSNLIYINVKNFTSITKLRNWWCRRLHDPDSYSNKEE